MIEVFDDSDKEGADFVLVYVCPKSGMPNPDEGPLEVYEDIYSRGFAGAEDVSHKGFVA